MTDTKEPIYISYGTTESSDALIVLNWGNEKPADDDVNRAYKKLYPEEFKEVGFVNWQITTLQDPPKTRNNKKK